ncbi:hypothetical protein PIB30_042258 [Stylosanthes scabra]|uniref:Uncharacterized protein n=1 Tax=Stylosanthes scabra TaxID=79078 RepID=A0ABU6SG08_9FABA|nr:hypothetical protein [Stylosanthes scabra]
MGCCFSTINTLNTNKDQNALKLHQPHPITTPSPKSDLTHENPNHIPPPPPTVEEESVVKEVLSETPIPKPQVSILTIETETQFPKIQYSNCSIFNQAQEQVSRPSHITQTCSISESFFSTTTTTATTTSTAVTRMETREDEATSKLRTIEETQSLNRSQSNLSKRSCDVKSIGAREQRPKSPRRTLLEKRIPSSTRPARQRDSGQVNRDSGTGRRVRSPSAVRRFSGGNSGNQVKPMKSVVVDNGIKPDGFDADELVYGHSNVFLDKRLLMTAERVIFAGIMARKTMAKKLKGSGKKKQYNNKSSPSDVAKLLEKLSSEQKAVVRDMGFGALKNLSILNISKKMMMELVDSFNTNDNSIRTTLGRIKLDASKIGDALGLNARGNTYEKKIENKKLSDEQKAAVNSFKGVTILSLKRTIIETTVDSEENTRKFKRAFTLFIQKTFLSTTNFNPLSTKYFPAIVNVDNPRQMNLARHVCNFLLDGIA